MGPFDQLMNKEIESHTCINTIHVIYTAKVLLPQLKTRAQKGVRSGVMVTSSGLGIRPTAGTITYSASKSFVGFLARGLNYECKNNGVDFLSFYAGEVSTKMLNNRPAGLTVISAERAADASLRDLGLENHTRGSKRHEIFTHIFDSIPLSWMQALMFMVGKGVLKKIRARQESRDKKKE